MQFDADYFARQTFHDAVVPNVWHSAQVPAPCADLAFGWPCRREGGGRNGERSAAVPAPVQLNVRRHGSTPRFMGPPGQRVAAVSLEL